MWGNNDCILNARVLGYMFTYISNMQVSDNVSLFSSMLFDDDDDDKDEMWVSSEQHAPMLSFQW